MDNLWQFFGQEAVDQGPIPTDYLQSDGPAAPPDQPPADPPQFDDEATFEVIPDSYQQADSEVVEPPMPPADAWDHFQDPLSEDQFHIAVGALVGDVIPPAVMPSQHVWSYEDELPSFTMPDGYLQADVFTESLVPSQEWQYHDDGFHVTPIPDGYLQSTTVAVDKGPDPAPLFDGNDEDLDELVIIDFPNFNNTRLPIYEDIHHHFRDEVVDDWFTDTSLMGLNVVGGNEALQQTGPVFDGNDEDLDELVILDFPNFKSEIVRSHEPDFDVEVEDFRPAENDRGPRDEARRVDPDQGGMVITGLAPVVTTSLAVLPDPGLMELAGFAPTVTQTRIIAPTTGALTLTGHVPTVSQALQPGVGALTLTGYEPTIGLGRGAIPDQGALTLAGQVPTVSQPLAVNLTQGNLGIVGYAPVITTTGAILPEQGAMLILGLAPTLTQPRAYEASPGVLTLTGYAPSVTQDRDSRPEPGYMTLTGYAPAIMRLSTPQQRHIDIDPEDRVIDPRAP